MLAPYSRDRINSTYQVLFCNSSSSGSNSQGCNCTYEEDGELITSCQKCYRAGASMCCHASPETRFNMGTCMGNKVSMSLLVKVCVQEVPQVPVRAPAVMPRHVPCLSMARTITRCNAHSLAFYVASITRIISSDQA